MASVLRTGLANLNPTGLIVGLCKGTSKRHNVAITQIAHITSRELRRDRPPRPPPYDWRNKKTGIWCYHMDPMFERFDDNTKVVVVEGMPAVGKDKVAKKLAQELEMKYIPPPNFDDLWINPYGFDLRSLNDQLPPNVKHWDLTTFLEDPKSLNVAIMQITMLSMRCSQYIDALADVLSSGVGVVLQRTPWTDPIFMEAMAKSNYVSKTAHDYHRCAVEGTLHEFMKPHLIIYLDAPVSVIKQNIKKRNIPYEVNSKALTDDYLHEMERLYKEYLREMSKHGNLLVYDWSKEGDIGVVVEDIERLDFDESDPHELKFHDWKWDREFEIKQRRFDFCMMKSRLMAPLNICRLDVPEMFYSGDDSRIYQDVMEEVVSEKYVPGYNPEFDKGILFKTKQIYEDWLPRNKVRAEK